MKDEIKSLSYQVNEYDTERNSLRIELEKTTDGFR